MDVTFKTFAGLRNDIPPERFESGDLEAAVNVDIGKNGELTRRAGRTLVSATGGHSLWSNGSICLYVVGGILKRVHEDYTMTDLASLVDDRPVSYVSVNGRVYYSNGFDTGVIDLTGARTWGIVPPGLPAASQAGGVLPEGTYQYVVTFIREDGQESGAGLAGQFQCETGGIRFTSIPVSSDPTVTHKAIYITPQNGDVLYRAIVLDNTTTEYTYSGGPLSLPLMTQYLEDAPAGDIVAYHSGVMYVVDGSNVFYSTPFGYELFDPRAYLSFDSPVQIFAPVDGGIWVGTQKDIRWMAGNDPASFELSEPRADTGSTKGTLVYAQAKDLPDIKESIPNSTVALWWTDDGACAGYPGGVLKRLTESRYQPGVTGKKGAGIVSKTSDGSRYIAVINH